MEKRNITHEIFEGMKLVFKSKMFYLSLIVLILGFLFNFASQVYLHSFISKGNVLPVLSDLILDNLPYYNFSWAYDLFTVIAFFVFIIYIVDKRKYNNIPFFMFIFGLFYMLRGIFVILTPFGNPANFQGTAGLFKGFAVYELGVYPSGHLGASFLYFLFSRGVHRVIIGVLSFLVIMSLFVSRGHYSIDILSAVLFSYALYSFGSKYFLNFKLKSDN